MIHPPLPELNKLTDSWQAGVGIGPGKVLLGRVYLLLGRVYLLIPRVSPVLTQATVSIIDRYIGLIDDWFCVGVLSDPSSVHSNYSQSSYKHRVG